MVPNRQPVDPVAVFIADYGIHSSLLLPNGDGRFVEYAFGDWGYAAEGHAGPHDAVGALLVSFQSAFGRRFINMPYGAQTPAPHDPAPGKLTRVLASRTDVQRLVAELDERYRRHADIVRHNPDNNLDFVKDSEHYSIAHNCNHLTASSLRELGCHIYGWVGTSKFHVRDEPQVIAAEPIKASPAASVATLPSARID